MTEAKPFTPVKLICGLISSEERFFEKAETRLVELYGQVDHRSPLFDFNWTDYYEKQMGKGLKRKFLSFEKLILPEELSEIKTRTNELEEEIRSEFKENLRVVNLDPGYITASALVMATAKDFAHRIPLQQGIYAHLELLFCKKEIKLLDWTYPDFKSSGYQRFFRGIREVYLEQLKTQRS
ncbi:MAG: DUF4416 family protein [Candidatus Aminicenantes bacterium]|nr:DUF4416 family protein [Candidatus Aminicenantes bacterium]